MATATRAQWRVSYLTKSGTRTVSTHRLARRAFCAAHAEAGQHKARMVHVEAVEYGSFRSTPSGHASGVGKVGTCHYDKKAGEVVCYRKAKKGRKRVKKNMARVCSTRTKSRR